GHRGELLLGRFVEPDPGHPLVLAAGPVDLLQRARFRGPFPVHVDGAVHDHRRHLRRAAADIRPEAMDRANIARAWRPTKYLRLSCREFKRERLGRKDYAACLASASSSSSRRAVMPAIAAPISASPLSTGESPPASPVNCRSRSFARAQTTTTSCRTSSHGRFAGDSWMVCGRAGARVSTGGGAIVASMTSNPSISVPLSRSPTALPAPRRGAAPPPPDRPARPTPRPKRSPAPAADSASSRSTKYDCSLLPSRAASAIRRSRWIVFTISFAIVT